MTAVSDKDKEFSDHDFYLGVPGFKYSDLFDAARLKDLADKFYEEVAEKEPVLHDALTKYIASHGDRLRKTRGIEDPDGRRPISLRVYRPDVRNQPASAKSLKKRSLQQNPIWRYKFFVQRRAVKKHKAEDIGSFNENELDLAVSELRNKAFDETLIHDEELAIASIAARLLDAEEILAKELDMTLEVQNTINTLGEAYEKLKDSSFGATISRFILEAEGTGDLVIVKAALGLLEAWSAVQFFKKEKRWHSFKVPHALDYQNLVHLIHPEPELHNIMRGAGRELAPPRRL